ncbi:MAG: hypothetical protein N3D73_00445 [Candidatus Diapherotrites archaeon]|nr:hypothetical protein [Candidatus Diapherotrites archaeon]
MPENIFKIGVYVVITIIIISLLFNYFQKPTKTNIEIIKELIKDAEFNEGMVIEKEIEIKEKEVINVQTVENNDRTVRIKCTSEILCTPDSLEFDERILKANKNIPNLKVYVRCEHQLDLSVCNIYFGKKPAQLFIKKLELFEDKTKIFLELENIGEFSCKDINVTIKKCRIGENENITKEKYCVEKTEFLEEINANDKKNVIINLGNITNGRYLFEIKTYAEECGLNVKSLHDIIEIEQTNPCLLGEIGESVLIEGKCKQRFYCSNCQYAYQCKEAWAQKIPEKAQLFEIESKEYTIIQYEPTEGRCE